MNKEKWIDEVLLSGKNIVPVEVNPFLHTRIESRIAQEKPIQRIQSRWVLALATAMIIALTLNIYLWFDMQHNTKSSGIQQIIREYGWGEKDIFSLNYSK